MDASFEVVRACMRELDAARREIARLRRIEKATDKFLRRCDESVWSYPHLEQAIEQLCKSVRETQKGSGDG